MLKKFVILDGNAIVHRTYHALPPLTTKDGTLVNAVYGFCSMLLKMLHDLKPDYVAVTFDMAGGSKARLEKFADYKATRVKADQALYDQIPLTHELVAAFGIPIFERQGYEADDLIGTIVEKMKTHRDIETYIVTGDMDTLQLVNDHVKIYTLRKGLNDIIVYDKRAVHDKFGFGPEHMVDYKALRGDVSDNIPGVPGIGEKTASDLIQKFGTVEEIYKKIKKLKELGIRESVIKKLAEGEDKARMSFALATIDRQVPGVEFSLEKCRFTTPEREKLLPLFQKFEFISLLRRLPGGEGAGAPAKGAAPRHKKRDLLGTLAVTAIENEEDVAAMAAVIKKKQRFAAKIVLDGIDLFTSPVSRLLVVTEDGAWDISAAHVTKALVIFAEKDWELVGHDLKQLVKVLAERFHHTIKNKLFDIMIASYLLQPGSRATDAGSIILKVLGKEVSPGGGAQVGLFGVDVRLVCYELYLVLKTRDELARQLIGTNDIGLMQNMEMPLIFVLAHMELAGVAVDTNMLAELSRDAAVLVKKVTEKIYKRAGGEFNIASPIQLREVLFEKMDIPTEGIKKGKTGLSTSADELEKLRGLDPIIEDILEFREITKLQNTYIDVLPTLIHPTTHRIHSSFNQAVAATGRLSSSDPNLQNIPIRTELGRKIRDAFIAEEGFELISADYSQIELRIVASLAEDKKMMEIFEKDEDIHQATAAAIHGVPLAKVTKDMRRSAKEVNFGVLYGMGAHGLSWRAGISFAEAKRFIEKYFQEFSGVKKYIDTTLAFTKKEGYCETLFGRRRYLPELNSTNFQLRSAAERMAVNHPVQGTAADLMKMAMIDVHRYLVKEYPGRDARLIMQVHDELVLEVKKPLVAAVMPKLKELMEKVVELRVPVKAEVGSGKRWGEIK